MSDDVTIDPAEARREALRANLAKAREARKTNREARKSAPAVGSPDFEAAVAAAVEAQTAKIIAALSVARATEPSATEPSAAKDDLSWARQLTMELAKLNDQGPNRPVRLAPEIVEQRERARERMIHLLVQARKNGDRPVYQLINKIQMRVVENGVDKGEAIIDPIWIGNDKIHYPTEIECLGVPNQAMRPVDDVAREIFAAFTESIGNLKVEGDIEEIAMTPGGVVVRGGAAASLFRATGRAPVIAAPGGVVNGDLGESSASVRRHQPSPTKEIRVLGTIQPPARQNA